MVDDRQGWICVLVFGCPDIASGWIDFQAVKMSRNAGVLQDPAGRDIVLDQASGATRAGCINAITISPPETFPVGRDRQIIRLGRAGWRRARQSPKGVLKKNVYKWTGVPQLPRPCGAGLCSPRRRKPRGVSPVGCAFRRP